MYIKYSGVGVRTNRSNSSTYFFQNFKPQVNGSARFPLQQTLPHMKNHLHLLLFYLLHGCCPPKAGWLLERSTAEGGVGPDGRFGGLLKNSAAGHYPLQRTEPARLKYRMALMLCKVLTWGYAGGSRDQHLTAQPQRQHRRKIRPDAARARQSAPMARVPMGSYRH